MAHEPSVVVYLVQVVTLLVWGRFMGELVQRTGQPLVMGHLIAGILLGPSIPCRKSSRASTRCWSWASVPDRETNCSSVM
jgi:Kef-type K+ transport system membrane component KefB